MGQGVGSSRTTGSQEAEIAAPLGGQEPPSAQMDHAPAATANLWRGEKGSRVQNALYPDCKREDFIKALGNL